MQNFEFLLNNLVELFSFGDYVFFPYWKQPHTKFNRTWFVSLCHTHTHTQDVQQFYYCWLQSSWLLESQRWVIWKVKLFHHKGKSRTSDVKLTKKAHVNEIKTIKVYISFHGYFRTRETTVAHISLDNPPCISPPSTKYECWNKELVKWCFYRSYRKMFRWREK